MALASKLLVAALLISVAAFSQQKNTKDKFTFTTKYYIFLDKKGNKIQEGEMDKTVRKNGDTLEVISEDQLLLIHSKMSQKWDVTFNKYEPSNQMVLFSGEQITHWDGVDQIYMYVDWWLLNKVYLYFPDRTEVYYNKHIGTLVYD